MLLYEALLCEAAALRAATVVLIDNVSDYDYRGAGSGRGGQGLSGIAGEEPRRGKRSSW